MRPAISQSARQASCCFDNHFRTERIAAPRAPSRCPLVRLGRARTIADQSGLAPEDLTTLAHRSVSSAMSLPKSAGEPASTVPPSSRTRALNLGLPRPALIDLLIVSTISAE